MFEHFVFREKYHWTWPLSLHYERTLGFTSHIMTLLEQGYRRKKRGHRIQYSILDFCMKKLNYPVLIFFHKKSFPELQLTIFVGDGIEYS